MRILNPGVLNAFYGTTMNGPIQFEGSGTPFARQSSHGARA